MAYIIRRFGCEACNQEFDVMQERHEAAPKDCPFCGPVDDITGPIPSTTAIGARVASKAADGAYRDLEQRTAANAELANNPGLKVTDLKDQFYGGGMREGDVAGVTVKNAVTDYADQTGHQFFAAGAPGGIPVTDAIAMSKHGRERTNGSVALRQIQSRTSGGTPQVSSPQIRGTFGGG